MLLAVMFLLVGVPNAPVLSTTVAHIRPSLEQTSNGTASTETSRLKSTSKDIAPFPSTFRTETMLTNAPLERTTLRVTSAIPESTPQYLSESTSSSTRWVSSSTNPIDRSTGSNISSYSTTGSSLFPTTRSTPTTTRETIEGQIYTTELSGETSLEVPTTPSQESIHIVIAGSPNSVSGAARTELLHRTTYPIRTRWSGEKAQRTPTSMTNFQAATTVYENSPTLKPITFRSGVSIVTHRKQTTSNAGVKSMFIPPITTIGPQKSSSTLLKDRQLITSKSIVAVPKLPMPLWSQNQKYTDMTRNAVEPMRHVPMSSQEITSLSFENEFENVFHPTLPSISLRKATKSPKNDRPDDAIKATTPSLVTLLNPDSPKPDYYQYGTTSPIVPILNLLSNQSLLHSTSAPMTRASISESGVSHIIPSLPLKTTSDNQTVLPPVFSFDDASYPKLPEVVPPPVQTRYGNRSVLQPVLPLGKSSPENRKLPYVVPPPVQTKDGNQSVLHPIFPLRGYSRDNRKLPYVVPPPPVQTKDKNQSVLHPILSLEGSSPDNRKLPFVVPPPLQTKDKNQSVLHPILSLEGSSPDNRKLPYVVPPPVQTKDGNQSVLRPVLPPDAKLRPVVPSFRLTTIETLPAEILPTIAAMDSVIVNLTQNCSNDYCVSDEDYIDMMLAYMFPTDYEWVLIGMHIIVFIGGLVGNALVCLAVYRNHSMRTVTNYFIVNLAVADFLVILLCLPPTVLWDVTETWFMGTALCKIVLYFQTVSVAVSVLTLTFISIDRWYAICCPLKFKSTTGRAKTAIAVIWVLALAFDIPEMVVLQTKRKELNIDTLFFTQCQPSWSDKTDMAFHCLQTILLYTVPLVFMSIAYYQIVKVLWSSNNIPGHKERLNCSGNNTQSTSCRSDTIARKKNYKRSISNTVSTTGQVICRRKAAKMLVAVVIMFAVCYFPVHLLSILRYIYDIPQTDATTAFSMVSHWLCYANSAVNPLIYNFMSGKFRKEFANTFGCHRFSWRRPTHMMRRRRRHQVVASLGDRAVRPTEMAPLSRNGVANFVVDVEHPC